MALIKCDECGRDVSDRAVSCPNCGFPIISKTTVKIQTNSDGDTSKRFEAIPSTDCVNEFVDDFGNRLKYLVYTILFVLTAILGFSIGSWFATVIPLLLALKSFWAFLSGDASGSGL